MILSDIRFCLLKSYVFGFLNAVGAASLLSKYRVNDREVALLTFHRVSDEPDPLWPPMPVATFRKMIEFLARNTTVMALQDLWKIEQYPDKPLICLTFDDGYMDFYENALPILKHYGLPCLHSICPGLIDDGGTTWTQVVNAYIHQHPGAQLTLPDGHIFLISAQPKEQDFLAVMGVLYKLSHAVRSPFINKLKNALRKPPVGRLMEWDEIRACQLAGVEIGSHSLWHSHLPTIDNEAVLRDEIAGSRRRIFEELGEYPSVFAFPSGFYDNHSLRLVLESGYRIALLCEDMVFQHRPLGADEFSVFTRINVANGSFHEEKLRTLGFHQRAKRLLRGKPYVSDVDALVLQS
ncbi:MAG: polysaccharide deacetylase family protein [Glaciimonas sp.]|nr:polysaccharide deacetylase family protein [Glaciimonas sp.]